MFEALGFHHQIDDTLVTNRELELPHPSFYLRRCSSNQLGFGIQLLTEGANASALIVPPSPSAIGPHKCLTMDP